MASEEPRAKKRKLASWNQFELSEAVSTEFIDEIFVHLKAFCHSAVERKPVVGVTTELSALLSKIQDCTNLPAITEACEHLAICYTGPSLYDGVMCKLCFKDGKKAGLFSFTNNDNLELEKESKQTPKFKNLKTNIKSHLVSFMHGYNLSLQNGKRESPASKLYLSTKVDELKSFIESIIPKLETAKPVKEKNENCLSGAKSIDEIVNSSPHLQLYFKSQDDEFSNQYAGIICTPCRTYEVGKNSKSKVGIFQYSCNEIASFYGNGMTDTAQEEKFRHLKGIISDHFNSVTHTSLLHIERRLSANEVSFRLRCQIIGMILGKVAYKCVVTHQSKSQYEKELTFLADLDIDIGDINHGRHFLDTLIPHLFFVLKNETITVLNSPILPFMQPSPYVIFADKITPNGTTFQIIGIIIYRDGKNVPLVLDILPVNHTFQNGKALAQDIVNTIHKFYTVEAAKKMYVGCAFDGQYRTLSVPEEILELLGFEVDKDISKEERGQQLFHSFSWDPAHLLELACGDVKKSKQYNWVDKTEQGIVAVNKGNSIGKAYLILKQKALQMNTVLMRPGSFSETRFATYKHEVLRRFHNNYEMLYEKLKDEDDADIHIMNSCSFCIQLCGLIDIYTVIGETSKCIQSSEIFPWEADEKIETCVQRLVDMFRSPSESSWKCTNDAIKEMRELGTFKKQAVYFQQTAAHGTRSHTALAQSQSSLEVVIEQELLNLQQYAKALSSSIHQRYSKNHHQKSFVVAREAFSLTNILSRPFGEIPEEFESYCDLARKFGFISAASQEDLNSQYKLFAQEVKTLYHKYKIEKISITEAELYWKVLNSCEAVQNDNTFSHLLISAVVRNKSECFAESIGSTIKAHLEKRCSLSDKNLGMEVFLHSNGPKPNRESNGLIQQALNLRFGGPDWHVARKSSLSDLKKYDLSKVVDKHHSQNGKVIVSESK